MLFTLIQTYYTFYIILLKLDNFTVFACWFSPCFWSNSFLCYGKWKLYFQNTILITVCTVLVFTRLQLLLQRQPLFQTGGQQLEDCQVGWNHKGLAWLLSISKMSCNWLIPAMTSWGHCHNIIHNLRSPQCTLLYVFILATLHASVGDMSLPACITSLQLCRKAPWDFLHRLNIGNWIFAILLCDIDFLFVMLMQIYYNVYPLFFCFIVFCLFVCF